MSRSCSPLSSLSAPWFFPQKLHASPLLSASPRTNISFCLPGIWHPGPEHLTSMAFHPETRLCLCCLLFGAFPSLGSSVFPVASFVHTGTCCPRCISPWVPCSASPNTLRQLPLCLNLCFFSRPPLCSREPDLQCKWHLSDTGMGPTPGQGGTS